MLNILQDVKIAIDLIGKVNKARKSGAVAIQLCSVYCVPSATSGSGFYNTIEGCLTWRCGSEVDKAIMDIFKSLPYGTQRWLEFTPDQPGGWVERAQFWRKQLQPVLPEKTYHTVMVLFIGWYAHCLRERKKVTERG